MLMRLNLDGVKQVHVYYPASGKKFFDRLRYGTIYHETIEVIEHPIEAEGLVDTMGGFSIEAYRLQHGIYFGYRIKENDEIKFYKDKLKEKGIWGPAVKQLQQDGYLIVEGNKVLLDEVSYLRKGDVVAVVLDTRYCEGALKTAQGAKILLAQSTYLESEKDLAHSHYHMTAKQAGLLAKEAGAEKVVLTHFSARYVSGSDFENEARTLFPNAFAAEDLSVFPFPEIWLQSYVAVFPLCPPLLNPFKRDRKRGPIHTVRNYAIDLNAFKNFLEKEWHPTLPKEQLPPKINHTTCEHYQPAAHDALLPLQTIDKLMIRKFFGSTVRISPAKKDHCQKTSRFKKLFPICRRTTAYQPQPDRNH